MSVQFFSSLAVCCCLSCRRCCSADTQFQAAKRGKFKSESTQSSSSPASFISELSFFISRFFSNPIQWNWSWKFGYFLKNFWRPFWAYLWLESKTMVFVRSSKVTNGWLVTIHDPESFIVTLQGYALQGYNGFLGVIHGYQFHWSLSRTLQMVHW